MSEIFRVALSLSLSGSVLIVMTWLICRLLKRQLSARWQYYIWLVVVLRLVIPFSFDFSSEAVPVEQKPAVSSPAEATLSVPEVDSLAPEVTKPPVVPQEPEETDDGSSFATVIEALSPVLEFLWIPWLLVALILLIRKITLYQSFVKYVRAGKSEVSDPAILNHFADICEQMKIRRPIELYTNSLVSSPLLMGIRKPYVILPAMPAGGTEFRYICLHELTHYKCGDIFYKWMMQIVLCLHWFNPLVHLMVRETTRLCELSCDSALIQKLSAQERILYGDTLLDSLKNPGEYREGIAALTLSENASRLSERLSEIKRSPKKRKWVAVLSVVLAAVLFCGGFSLGVYTAERKSLISEPNGGELSPEGLPIMSASNREVFEKYIDAFYMTGLLRVDFTPEDPTTLVANGGSIMRSLFNILLPEPLTDEPEPIPASLVKEMLTAKLDVGEWTVEGAFADVYDEATDTYELYGGIGGGPSLPVVTRSERLGELITVHYTWYDGDPSADGFRFKAGNSGILIVRLIGDNFQFVSNQVIPLPELEVTANPDYDPMTLDSLQILYINPLGATKVITEQWAMPDEIDPDAVLITYEIMLIDSSAHEAYLQGDSLYIPEQEAEAYAEEYFGVNAERLRRSSCYDGEQKNYIVPFGLGGAWDVRATGKIENEDLIEILYVLINSDGLVDSQGIITIQMNPDGSYQYLSNRMEEYPQGSVAYVDQNQRSVEENIILLSVVANLTLESWNGPMEIAPDNLFEYYEAMVIYGETEKLAGEYIPADIALSVIQPHFDIDAEHLKKSNYYDAERDAFFIAGLGNVVEFTIESITADGQNTVIAYAIYFRDELQRRGEMTVTIADGGYKYVSNKVIQVPDTLENEVTNATESEDYATYTFYARQLMEQAHTVFTWYMSDAPFEELWTTIDAPSFERDGLWYRKVVRFKTLDELLAETERVFTKEFCENYFADTLANGKFIEIDGELYVGDNGGISEGATWPPKDYILRSATEDEIVFLAICEGPDPDEYDRSVPYSFELILRNEGPMDENSSPIDAWRVDSYYAFGAGGEYGNLQPME
jgi:beta-lactamase regulating signal transducer with metallopeptidase domain